MIIYSKRKLNVVKEKYIVVNENIIYYIII